MPVLRTRADLGGGHDNGEAEMEAQHGRSTRRGSDTLASVQPLLGSVRRPSLVVSATGNYTTEKGRLKHTAQIAKDCLKTRS